MYICHVHVVALYKSFSGRTLSVFGHCDGWTLMKALCRLLGMDVYGYLMAREGHLEDVEVLGGRLFNISDQHAEPWVISGWVRWTALPPLVFNCYVCFWISWWVWMCGIFSFSFGFVCASVTWSCSCNLELQHSHVGLVLLKMAQRWTLAV